MGTGVRAVGVNSGVQNVTGGGEGAAFVIDVT